MEDPLDRHLAQWTAPRPPPDLEAQVWQTLSRQRSSPLSHLGGRWFAQPAFLAMTAACGVLLALFLVERRALDIQREHTRQLAESYLRMIDPLLGPAPAGRLEDQLAW